MKKIADIKNIKSIEKRMSAFFFALTDGEKSIRTLADTINVSLSTAKRYAHVFERAEIIRVAKTNGNGRRGKKGIGLSPSLCFAVVKIEKKMAEISTIALFPRYEYSVALPYNEALNDTDNALCLKRTLRNLCAQVRAEKVLVGVVLSDGACIDEGVCNEVFCDVALSNFKGKILVIDKQRAQNISTEEIISALVIEMIKNIRDKTIV